MVHPFLERPVYQDVGRFLLIIISNSFDKGR
jgi:hypothetical protein